VSTRNCSLSPCSSPSRPRVGTRAAASSMASAIPSRPRTITPMRRRSSSDSSLTPAWRARSTNSATASPSLPSLGSDRRGTGNTHSNGTMSRARLVASTDTPGQCPSSRSTNTATASDTCSQLSSTSNASCSARCASTASSIVRPRGSSTPRAAATAAGTSDESLSGTRSTNHTPSARERDRSAATWAASRVLPTPPGPTAVTKRCSATAAASSATSTARPTNEVRSSGTGRAIGGAATATCGAAAATAWSPATRRPMARSASWRRSDAPSLRNSDDTWLSTVRTETKRRAAISALVAR
jgi:hypothetical protein